MTKKIATKESWEISPMPEKNSVIDFEAEFSIEEFENISMGSIPDAMEDKWFIYFENDILYFHRSWTGNCIYQIMFEVENEKYIAKHTIVNRDKNQYKNTNDQEDIISLQTLFKSYFQIEIETENKSSLPATGDCENADQNSCFDNIVKVAGVFAIENKDEVFSHMAEDSNVLLVREPENEYDENAIMVVNSAGNKLGYIPKSENISYVKKMDSEKIEFIGEVTNSDEWDDEIYINITERPISPIDDMISFEYEMNGFFAPRTKCCLDVKQRKFVYEYSEHIAAPQKQVIEFVFYPDAWKKAWSMLEKCNFHTWEDYYDSCTLDGVQWELTVQFDKEKQVKSGGSNAYPPEWFYFQSLIDECRSLQYPLKGDGKFYMTNSLSPSTKP